MKFFRSKELPIDVHSYREFAKVDDVIEWAAPIYGNWMKEDQDDFLSFLKQGKSLYLQRYCGNCFWAYNLSLRVHDTDHDTEITALDALLREIPLTDNIVVYRRVSTNCIYSMQNSAFFRGYNMISLKIPCDFLTEPGFVSTYTVKSLCVAAADQTDYIMKIYIPKGAVGAYVDFISKRPEEHEFLLSYDCTFRVLRWSHKRVIDCLLINQQGKNLLL